jgi:hypothetical protein
MPSAVFNQATAATHTAVAAPGAGRFLRVLGWHLHGAGTGTVTLQSGSTPKAGPMTDARSGAVVRTGKGVGGTDGNV